MLFDGAEIVTGYGSGHGGSGYAGYGSGHGHGDDATKPTETEPTND